MFASDSGAPVDVVSPEAVREQLARILQSQAFNSAPVLSQMLRYVVVRTLEGKADELKEYALGVDVFGRGASFDPRADTIVRVQARRLRSKLEDYYNIEGRTDAVLIELPKGRYAVSARLFRPATEAALALPDTPAHSEALGSSVLPVERRFASRRLQVVLGVAAVLVILAVGVVLYRSGVTSRPAIKSLAVLPLKNLSGDPAQEYFADGMTEAVIGRLAMIRGLRVISRTSVMRFKDTRASVPEIARTLGVDAIVEGSVIREGGRVRVHAQLIRGATDDHFWSEEYDRELEDTLALESDIAQAIAQKVEVTVTGEEHARLVAARPVSPEVYESYLKGEFLQGNSKAEVEKSITYFEDAIRRDPTFAPAYVSLAFAYEDLGSVYMGVPAEELRPKVISAARKALELDPGLAEAHVLLARVDQSRWQWADADTEYRRALELNPNDADAHLGYAEWLLCQGRTDEAVAWSRRGRELDPLGVTGTSIGWILFQSHRYPEAIRELRTSLAVHGDNGAAHWFMGYALIANGQPDDAILELEKARSLSDGSPAVVGVLIRAYAHAGRRTDALRLLDELKRRQQKGYVPAGAFVNAYLGIDDKEQAFVWLERCYQEKSNILQWLKVHPHFDPLRSDPRFVDLVRRVGLDQAR